MNQKTQPGLTISDRYTLVRALGSSDTTTGKSGEINSTAEFSTWLANDKQSGDDVTIKLFPAISQVAINTANLPNLTALVHPNIIRTLDLGKTGDGEYFVVCTYVDGLHPKNFLSADSSSILRSILPLFDALEYAHSLGIVHGAISDHCIEEDNSGNIYISGFGSELAAPDDGQGNDHLSPQVLANKAPQVTDDIYSLGALIYLIFTGEHWLRDERTGPANSPVPAQLQSFVVAMLSDSSYDRPQDIASVRSRIAEYLDPDQQKNKGAIQATTFSKATDSAVTPAIEKSASVERKSPQAKPAIPMRTALSMLAILVILLGGVFLYQPTPIEQSPADIAVTPEPAGDNSGGSIEHPVKLETGEIGPAPYELAQQEHQKDEATLIAARLLRKQIELEDMGGLMWASEHLNATQASADEGDTLFRESNFTGAIEKYQSAIDLLESLDESKSEIFSENLLRGSDALLVDDAESAIDAFTIASAIDPENTDATLGLKRARSLEALLNELAIASGLENSGDLTQALESYRKARAIDPESARAKDGVARVNKEITLRKFNQAMSAGFSALQVRDFSVARDSFRLAAELMPGSPLPDDGLSQVDIADRLQQIESFNKQAQALEATENWSDALVAYQAALALDQNLVFAHEGVTRVSKRIDLSNRLMKFVKEPLLLRDDEALKQAKDVLYEASMMSKPGPVLSSQITRIAKSIKLARVPVKVKIISDQQTDIIVYKVKPLGRIASTQLELFPGKYTAVGTRRGFRDARQEFTIEPGQQGAIITIACVDRI
jgi:serine/threonine protein kinase